MDTAHSFTINACNRCRQRKAKCDPGLPSCSPCNRSGSLCEYTDPRTKAAVPRTTILALEDELHELTLLSKAANSQLRTNSQPERMVNADMIRLEPGEDAHFLGVSSGMHLARSVLESAQNTDATLQASERHTTSFAETTASASTEVPIQQETHSGFAALPTQDTATHLVEIFLGQYEVQYPIVVGDELLRIVQGCYSSGTADESNSRSLSAANDTNADRRDHFILNMVFAIALIILSRENPESLPLAKMFSSTAMAELSTVMQRKDVRTLQCLQFLLLWSILDSTSAPVWYISGLCMRMCVDLGFHSEATINVSSCGTTSAGEADIKRRLFWVTYTFDRTLSTLLGRPFTLSDDTIDVRLPDQSLHVAKRDQILHWFKLQQLQSQIVYRLYSLRNDVTDAADAATARTTKQWKEDMAAELQRWASKATTLADPVGGSGTGNASKNSDHTLDWWEYWHQNAILLLHRPSPLKPQLDADEADVCCTAAQSIIQLSFTRLQRGSADFAWVDLHYQLMSGITLLFLVWKHVPTRTKAKASWISFKNCLMQWNFVLEQLARQWGRIQHARDVLTRLVNNTVDLVEKEMCNRLSASDVQVLRQAHSSTSRASRAARANRNKIIIRQLVPDAARPSVGHEGRHQQPRARSHTFAPEEVSQPQQSQLPPLPHHPSPPHQEIQQVYPSGISPNYIPDRRPSYETPRSDTVMNTNTFHPQSQDGNIYAMQASPSHSNGQPVSPWGSHGFHQHQSNLHSHADTSTSGSAGAQDQSAFLLGQQAWQGLELYDTFGAIPENITMLDYFSTFSISGHDGSISVGIGGQGGQAGIMGGAGVFQDLGGWPEPLTSSILNFQTDFPESGFGG